MWFGVGIIGFIIWVSIAFWPARVAGRKGHSFIGYFILSLFFFPLALIMAYVVARTDAALAYRIAHSRGGQSRGSTSDREDEAPVLLDLIIIGFAITLEPLPLTAFILILGAERGIRKGLAFLLSWLACLVVVIGAVVLFTGGTPLKSSSAPSTAALVVKILLGSC